MDALEEAYHKNRTGEKAYTKRYQESNVSPHSIDLYRQLKHHG